MIIYLMVYLPLPLFWKIGFANDSVINRAAALDKEVFGFFFPICWIYLPFAHRVEKAFHRLFRPLNTRVLYKGNGSTEIYWFPVAVPVLAFMLAWWGICVWAVGKIFGFDGIDWYVCFLQVLWGWGKTAWNYFF